MNNKKQKRQERNEYCKQWRLENKDKVRGYSRNYDVRHREKRLNSWHKYDITHKEERLSYRIKNRDKLALNVKKWTEKNIEHVKDHQKNYREKLRMKVLSHYGGNPPKCACCGETIINFLCIDHINGGGAKHYKKVGGHMYYYLLKNSFPKGFQVLCCNCNQGKQWNKGVCPHVTIRANRILHDING
jgi:hypothetical protein